MVAHITDDFNQPLQSIDPPEEGSIVGLEVEGDVSNLGESSLQPLDTTEAMKTQIGNGEERGRKDSREKTKKIWKKTLLGLFAEQRHENPIKRAMQAKGMVTRSAVSTMQKVAAVSPRKTAIDKGKSLLEHSSSSSEESEDDEDSSTTPDNASVGTRKKVSLSLPCLITSLPCLITALRTDVGVPIMLDDIWLTSATTISELTIKIMKRAPPSQTGKASVTAAMGIGPS
ncbi:hypothetical protein L6452_06056 [Arctium lappa]|uniref:Uncharacterized protein n=1 Tax=Arctium lappa TaxID=4217 RepID=A0ACB9EI59_ARCLA|nr:hypothetical protein L6452_06056 [Arctium lappa]